MNDGHASDDTGTSVPHTSDRSRAPSAEELTSRILRLIAAREISPGGGARFEDTLFGVMELISKTVGCDACTLFVYDPSTETLRLRAANGSNPSVVGHIALRVGSGITGLAAASRQTQTAAHVRDHPAFLPYALAGNVEYQGHISIPLMLRDPERLVGVLNLQTHEPHEFTPDQLRLVESIADGLAVGVVSALRYSETQDALARRVDQITTLQLATRAMATTLKMHDLLALIAGHGAQLAGASAASIYRLDVGEDGGTTMTMLYPEGEIGSDAESAYALMICQTRIARSAQPEGPDAPVVFGVPLMTQLGVWGALCMLSPEPVAIPDEHLSVLLAFADTATLALENAQLYEQTRRESTANATLLREMHHRVRNNLQIVAALLSIQANYQSNPAVAEPLREAVARVQAIASVHDLLSGGGVVTTTLRAVLERVVSQTMSAVKSPELDVDISIDCAEIIIDSRQATILALLVTECITNALLHAFAGRATGRIEIVARCSDADGEAMIAVLDDGIGLNERALPALDHGMGTQIVTTLASADLGGSFTLEPNLPSGTRAVLRFALRPLPGQ